MLPFRDTLRGWLLRRLPAVGRQRLTQQRIYLLPTPFGALLLLVAAAVWVGALNYGVSLAYALAFWVLALVCVSILMGFRQLHGLVIACEGWAPAFAGDTVGFQLRLTAPDTRLRRLQVHVIGSSTPVGGACELRGGMNAELTLAVPAERRGRLPLPPFEVCTEMPFGLVRAFAYVRLAETALVYPRPVPDTGRGRRQSGEEGAAVRFLPGNDDFAFLADYQPGDPLRRVAWRHWARRGSLVTKRFDSPVAQGVVRLDWADYPQGMDAESRLSRLTWRVLECERRSEAYLLRLPGMTILPGREGSLRALALYGGPSA
ncbi:Protein of unknown function DUF58 [Gulbenkiania indica]|uniref:Uncharacterized protein n=2 Tax=Gulbenkiania TaxID=397456 RepID=A0A0K6H6T7_9NEIS|nr:DUF58 domain-containing protein [Gulbenkiania indica]TCW29610.1 uncharacterized protein DUF58 [Gulbenkiania mobilis]CUA86697.1 Protein of unknown function DUF58 [Gulbenkiania indica]